MRAFRPTADRRIAGKCSTEAPGCVLQPPGRKHDYIPRALRKRFPCWVKSRGTSCSGAVSCLWPSDK
nr:MAG TPA: hypothetical protein [Caudoviricetes sp.]